MSEPGYYLYCSQLESETHTWTLSTGNRDLDLRKFGVFLSDVHIDGTRTIGLHYNDDGREFDFEMDSDGDPYLEVLLRETR